MTATSLFISVIAGAIGMGYFMYGKRQVRYAPMISGMILCVYPYFVSSTLWLCVIGLGLIVAPFLIDF